MNKTALTYYLTQALYGRMSYGDAFLAAGIVWNATQIAWWNEALAANPQQPVCHVINPLQFFLCHHYR
jgi:hypothetical protein